MGEALAKNLRRLGHLDMPGGGQVVVADGYAYVGHMRPPHGTSIIDVRDPMRPRIVATIKLPTDDSQTHKVSVTGDVMIVFVDAGGLVYLIDRDNGFDILEPSG